MSDPRVRIVEQGYDVIGDTFADWRDRIVGDPRRQWANELVSRLSEGDRVLELGCGAGVPDTQALAERLVTGVDISSEQVRRARENVPTAEFIKGDFTRPDLQPDSFEVVTFFEPEPDGEATFQWVLARR